MGLIHSQERFLMLTQSANIVNQQQKETNKQEAQEENTTEQSVAPEVLPQKVDTNSLEILSSYNEAMVNLSTREKLMEQASIINVMSPTGKLQLSVKVGDQKLTINSAENMINTDNITISKSKKGVITAMHVNSGKLEDTVIPASSKANNVILIQNADGYPIGKINYDENGYLKSLDNLLDNTSISLKDSFNPKNVANMADRVGRLSPKDIDTINKNSEKTFKTFGESEENTVKPYEIKVGENTFKTTNKSVFEKISKLEDESDKLAKIIQLYLTGKDNFGLDAEKALEQLDLNKDGTIDIIDATIAQRIGLANKEAKESVDNFTTFISENFGTDTEFDATKNEDRVYITSTPNNVIEYEDALSPFVDDIMTYLDKNKDGIDIEEFSDFATKILKGIGYTDSEIEEYDSVNYLFNMINVNKDTKLDRIEVMSIIAAMDASSFDKQGNKITQLYENAKTQEDFDSAYKEEERYLSGNSKNKEVYKGTMDGKFGIENIAMGITAQYAERTTMFTNIMYILFQQAENQKAKNVLNEKFEAANKKKEELLEAYYAGEITDEEALVIADEVSAAYNEILEENSLIKEKASKENQESAMLNRKWRKYE